MGRQSQLYYTHYRHMACVMPFVFNKSRVHANFVPLTLKSRFSAGRLYPQSEAVLPQSIEILLPAGQRCVTEINLRH